MTRVMFMWKVNAEFTEAGEEPRPNNAGPPSKMSKTYVVATDSDDLMAHVAEMNATLLAGWSDKPHRIRIVSYEPITAFDEKTIVIV